MSDNFNRASFSNPEFWTALTGSPAIVSSTYWQAAGISAAGTIFEMQTDNIRGEFVVANRQSSGKTVVMICCGPAFNSVNVGLELETGFFNNNYHIITNNGLSFSDGSRVDHGQTVQSVVNGDTIAFTYTASSNTFTTYYNGTQVSTWVDSGNLVSHGPGRRYCGIVQSSDSNTGVGVDSVRFYNF